MENKKRNMLWGAVALSLATPVVALATGQEPTEGDNKPKKEVKKEESTDWSTPWVIGFSLLGAAFGFGAGYMYFSNEEESN